MTDTAKKKFHSFFQLEIDKSKARDTGMAIVLILLLLEFYLGSGLYFKIAIPVLVMDMIVPQIYYPIAYIWFGLAKILGTVVSKIILFIVFSIIVLPVALIRRLMGKDSLLLRNWSTRNESIFKTRNHLFSSADIEKPY